MGDNNNEFKPYVKASERAENYKSSAYALLLVGGVGIVVLILALLGIIPITIAENIKSVGFIAMLIMFLIFIYIGIRSLVEAKTIGALATSEDELTDKIIDFFNTNHNAESIDAIALTEDDLSENNELKFFKRDETIRSLITDNFGELDSAYFDNMAEQIYSNIYEK